MKYEDGQTVILGDIVQVDLHDGNHTGKVIIVGDAGEYSGVDEKTAQWAVESGHVAKDQIMLEWVEPNPLANDDPKYAPVSNTLSTCLCGVVLIRRGEPSLQSIGGDSGKAANGLIAAPQS